MPPPPPRASILILKSVADTLALLASEPFAPAFSQSTDQNNYRWGSCTHCFPSRARRSVQRAARGRRVPGAARGIERRPDRRRIRGRRCIEPRSRAATLDGFMFGSGPNRRMVSGTSAGIKAVTSLPGGISGKLGDPLYINLLKPWLTNEAFEINLQSRVILPWGVQ
jgi:hypothetical protein